VLQITYFTQAASSGFTLVAETCCSSEPKQQNLVDCTFEQEHSNGEAASAEIVTATCHTDGLVHLDSNWRVFVKINGGYFRPMVMNPWSTFWGLNRVA
jgi:hypothetical protein